MTAKQYVEDVGSFLRCRQSKKKEIKKQLLSNINSAVEKGESLEEVLERMGLAWETAIQYNDSFSKAEKKAAKREKRLKNWGIILLIIMVIVGIVYSKLPKWRDINESSVFQREQLQTAAEEIISLYSGNEFEAVAECVNDDMEKVLNVSTLQYMKEQFSTDFGALTEIRSMSFDLAEYEGKQFALVRAGVSYENVSVSYVMIFDEKMKLSNFQIE